MILKALASMMLTVEFSEPTHVCVLETLLDRYFEEDGDEIDIGAEAAVRLYADGYACASIFREGDLARQLCVMDNRTAAR